MSFQSEELYVPPVRPEEAGKPQKMLHMDFLVDNLEAVTKHALECGATLAPTQFLDDQYFGRDRSNVEPVRQRPLVFGGIQPAT